MHALIAGAGIAGLTTALSLHAAGIDALLVDSAPELKSLGAGINLLPHAVRELTELGLGPALAATGIATSEQAHFDRHGAGGGPGAARGRRRNDGDSGDRLHGA